MYVYVYTEIYACVDTFIGTMWSIYTLHFSELATYSNILNNARGHILNSHARNEY